MKLTATCRMTMGSYGNYFECGKPAKAIVEVKMRGAMPLCGVHARMVRMRQQKQEGK